MVAVLVLRFDMIDTQLDFAQADKYFKTYEASFHILYKLSKMLN